MFINSPMINFAGAGHGAAQAANSPGFSAAPGGSPNTTAFQQDKATGQASGQAFSQPDMAGMIRMMLSVLTQMLQMLMGGGLPGEAAGQDNPQSPSPQAGQPGNYATASSTGMGQGINQNNAVSLDNRGNTGQVRNAGNFGNLINVGAPTGSMPQVPAPDPGSAAATHTDNSVVSSDQGQDAPAKTHHQGHCKPKKPVEQPKPPVHTDNDTGGADSGTGKTNTATATQSGNTGGTNQNNAVNLDNSNNSGTINNSGNFGNIINHYYQYADKAVPSYDKPVYTGGREGEVWGDPQFRDPDGGRYDITGEPGKIYNILSDRNVQFNARFAGAGDGGRTFMDQVGLRVGEHQILYGLEGAPTIDSAPMASGQWTDLGDSRRAYWKDNQLTVQTGEYDIDLTRKNGMLNSRVRTAGEGPLADFVAPHGLLGQTFDNGKVNQGQKGPNAQGQGAIEGTYQDYEVPGLFSTRFDYNRFGLQPTQFQGLDSDGDGTPDQLHKVLAADKTTVLYQA